MCLEAASLGRAGWPMAALADNAVTRAEIHERFGIPSDRTLVQAIRFGPLTGAAPRTATSKQNLGLVDCQSTWNCFGAPKRAVFCSFTR
jgi:hypothetical protein